MSDTSPRRTPLGELHDAALAAGAAAAEAIPLADHAEAWMVPAGYQVRTVDVEHLQQVPRRRRGTVVLETTDALAEYVNRHATPATVVYVHADGLAMRAVLNDHDAPTGLPGWRDHVADLLWNPTPSWLRWTRNDGKLLDQTDFAELVEQAMSDIVEPDGADVLEMAQSMHATTSAQFRSAQRLRDGQTQLVYVEEVNATAGTDGRLTIPNTLQLRFPVFHGAPASEFTARLRYRIVDRRLRLGVVLLNPVDVVRGVVLAEVARFTEATGLDPLAVRELPDPITPTGGTL